MPRNETRKRSQFSSCDACRRMRVACDSSRQNHDIVRAGQCGPCSRCARRGRPCTFDWIGEARKSAGQPSSLSRSFVRYDPIVQTTVLQNSGKSRERTQASDTPSSPVILTGDEVMAWGYQIFQSGLESILNLTTGRYGCPITTNESGCDVWRPAHIFARLDEYLQSEPLQCAEYGESTDQTRRYLNYAIGGFVSQWLPLLSRAGRLPCARVESIVLESWRTARKEMLKVLNITSYQSVLALYLFAQTPIPLGVTKKEKMDGVSGALCMQLALTQLQELRARHHTKQRGPSGSQYSPNGVEFSPHFMDLESRVYWTAMTWDTSASLTSASRTYLTSGLKGACSEPTWRLVKAFLVGSFIPRTEEWLNESSEINDQIAEEIISGSSICKIYIWKNITSLKEAFREGVDDEGVLLAWTALLDALRIFSDSIQPLLARCEKQLHFLDQRIRLMWYQVSLHYYFGVLLLVDILNAAGRSSMLQDINTAKHNAERLSFSVLKVGLDSTYTIKAAPVADPSKGREQPAITTTLVAIDPHPQYVVSYVDLMQKTLHRMHDEGATNDDSSSYIMSHLRRALEQLPQMSQLVNDALLRFQTPREATRI